MDSTNKTINKVINKTDKYSSYQNAWVSTWIRTYIVFTSIFLNSVIILKNVTYSLNTYSNEDFSITSH